MFTLSYSVSLKRTKTVRGWILWSRYRPVCLKRAKTVTDWKLQSSYRHSLFGRLENFQKNLFLPWSQNPKFSEKFRHFEILKNQKVKKSKKFQNFQKNSKTLKIKFSKCSNFLNFLWILKFFIFLKRKLSPLELRKPGLLFFMRISGGIWTNWS